MSINLKRPHLTNPCTSPRLPEKKNCQGKKSPRLPGSSPAAPAAAGWYQRHQDGHLCDQSCPRWHRALEPVHFTQIAWFSSIGISSGPGWPSKLPSMRPCSMRLSTAHSDEAIFEFILKYDIECDIIFASSVQFHPLCFWTPFELVPRDDRCLLWWTFCLANCRG